MKLINIEEFNIYGPYISSILTDAKILNDNSLSTARRFIGSFITGFLSILSLLQTISEVFDIKNCYDLPSFAAHMGPALYHSCGTFKWICAIVNANEIENLLVRMKRCHLISLKLNKNDKENYYYRIKMIKCKKRTTLFAGGYMTLLIYGGIRWCLNPIFYDLYNDIYGMKEINSSFTRHLPYYGVTPWNIDNFYKYITAFVFQALASLGAGIGHGVYEIMNSTFLAFTCSHLEYLNYVLMNQQDNELILGSDLAVENFKNKLRNCLIYHQEILGFADKLNQTTSTPMFIICSQSTLALLLVSLEVSTMKIDSSIESIMTASSLFEYWLGINIQLFLYCYLATKVQDLGLSIANAVYSCDWERAMISSKNNYINHHNDNHQQIIDTNGIIQFCLMRAQKPIIINGGLFYTLSLETYKALTGFSLSNAVILRQVSET